MQHCLKACVFFLKDIPKNYTLHTPNSRDCVFFVKD